MIVVVIGCSIVIGNGHHSPTIVSVVVPVIKIDVCAFGVGVEACPFDIWLCVVERRHCSEQTCFSFVRRRMFLSHHCRCLGSF